MHSRSGLTNPEGYDGAQHAVIGGQYFFDVLFMGTTGTQDFQRVVIEESKHFATHRNFEHAALKKEGDVERCIDHDDVFSDKLELIGGLAQVTLIRLRKLNFDNDMKSLYYDILNNLKRHIDTDDFYDLLKKAHYGQLTADDRKVLTDAFEKVLASLYQSIEDTLTAKNTAEVDFYFGLLKGELLQSMRFKLTDEDWEFSFHDVRDRGEGIAVKHVSPIVSLAEEIDIDHAQLGSAQDGKLK